MIFGSLFKSNFSCTFIVKIAGAILSENTSGYDQPISILLEKSGCIFPITIHGPHTLHNNYCHRK